MNHLDIWECLLTILKGQVWFGDDITKGIGTPYWEILDTRDLKIENVTDCSSGKSLLFSLGDCVHTFGSKLEIQLENTEEKIFSIKIQYETSPTCTALQWLTPEQTAGKKQPYLFSQCQAIHCRSMVPCQDTPGVKSTYSAQVSAPSPLVVLMSAVKQGSSTCSSDPTKAVYSFSQRIPIPSYLIAIVVGALESRDIGPRSKVWSEKEMVDAAAYEFAETEQMLQTAEALCGPYVWGVYDLLVLPPSFPYGGMENPCLTFVTPTLLAGDRSLASVVAHEITHSWTGNLVTTSNWQHFWLNEGHTVFIERKIKSRMNSEADRHFSAIGGWQDLGYQVNDVFGANHAYTHLVPDLTGVDPDDAFSSVPYEKGSSLLMNLEQLLGGPEVFEGFLRAYIDNFKYKSISTDDWKNFLYSYFKDKESLLNTVDWDTWFYKPGMPPQKPKFDSSLADACICLADKWLQCSEDDTDNIRDGDFKEMTSAQRKGFLDQLLDKPPLPVSKITKLEKLYQLNSVKNSEIRFRWLRLCLRAQVMAAIEPALSFVNEQGRMKFVRPIYRELSKWEKAKQLAVDNFKKQSIYMHPLTSMMVNKDLTSS